MDGGDPGGLEGKSQRWLSLPLWLSRESAAASAVAALDCARLRCQAAAYVTALIEFVRHFLFLIVNQHEAGYSHIRQYRTDECMIPSDCFIMSLCSGECVHSRKRIMGHRVVFVAGANCEDLMVDINETSVIISSCSGKSLSLGIVVKVEFAILEKPSKRPELEKS